MPSQDSEEANLLQKEALIPHLAKVAVRKAVEQALEAGQTLLIADQGVLYEVSKNGRRPIKQLPPSVKVEAGRVIKITQTHNRPRQQ